MSRLVAIAGNIGVGKSTLATLVAERMDWRVLLETPEENPYLSDFYADMSRWSFHSQMFFLSRRLLQYRSIAGPGEKSFVQDRTVYEDAEIFARHLYEAGRMSKRDWDSYRSLYSAIRDLLPTPTLVIHLRASVPTLLKRIATRGNEYERDINPQYLTELSELYERWASGFDLGPLVQVDTDQLDFLQRPGDLKEIIGLISTRLELR